MAPESGSHKGRLAQAAVATCESSGSSSEFEAEALPHLDALYRAAASILRSQAEAEDAVQETYLQALKSFHRFAPGTNCRAWLFRILFNVISHQRRKWLGRLIFTEREELERTAVSCPAVSEELTDDEMIAAFREIPHQFAEVVMLCDVHEFSYKEIHQTLGIPIGTVMSRLSRGRQLLRAQLAKCGARAGIVRAGARPAGSHAKLGSPIEIGPSISRID